LRTCRPFGRIEPFVGIGVGGETVGYSPELAWERQTDLIGNAVLGAVFWIADPSAIRFEGGTAPHASIWKSRAWAARRKLI
jgi:hypothetical protein